jgi:hypothetical protein
MNLIPLNSITATYPGFQSLPKGVKQMLLVSESLFFEEARTPQDLQSAQHQHDVHDLAYLAHADAVRHGQVFPQPSMSVDKDPHLEFQ